MKSKLLCLILLVLFIPITVSCGSTALNNPQSVTKVAFEDWSRDTGIPYENVQYNIISNDGTFATVRVTAYLRTSEEKPWLEEQTDIECQKIGVKWQADPSGFVYFDLTEKQKEDLQAAQKEEEKAVAEELEQRRQSGWEKVSILGIEKYGRSGYCNCISVTVTIRNDDNISHDVDFAVWVKGIRSGESVSNVRLTGSLYSIPPNQTYTQEVAAYERSVWNMWSSDDPSPEIVKWEIVGTDGEKRIPSGATQNDQTTEIETIDFIKDHASIFTKDEIVQMENILEDLEQHTAVEIYVVTVNSLEGKTIEEYAFELFKSLGIGKRSGSDNGILFLIAKSERQCRIEVGWGVEDIIYHDVAQNIIDGIAIPHFKNNEYGLGSYEVIKKLAEEVLAEI